MPTNASMLSQLKHLECVVDGRYATDAELQFIMDYVESFQLRLQTYLKLRQLESIMMQEAYRKMRSIAPSLLLYDGADMSAKWKQDTLRVWRYTALTVLVDDPSILKERLLLWFRSIMLAFGTQRSCEVTYQILQTLVCHYLPVNQAELVVPILKLNCQVLGESRKH